jgi:DNA-binding GntR family transcriptional regulator
LKKTRTKNYYIFNILLNIKIIYNVSMDAINTPTYMRLRNQVRADIISGIWPLGSHVTLAQLSSHYQVSANPVREALLQLQGEGVVSMRMNRGAIIPLVDEKHINDLYSLRGAIQSMLVRHAAQRATAQQIETLQELASAYEINAKSNGAAAAVDANRALHRYIDGIGDNPLAVDVLEGRSSLVDALRRSLGYGPGRLDLVIQQHRQLVQAIAAGDADAAARIVLEHNESSRMDLVARLRATKH